MQKPTVRKCDVFIVTCEIKHRKQPAREIVLGVFADEDLAKDQAKQMFQEKRKQFLQRILNTSAFIPAALLDQEKSWVVSYWPSGKDTQEYVKVHVTPNYIRTDL